MPDRKNWLAEYSRQPRTIPRPPRIAADATKTKRAETPREALAKRPRATMRAVSDGEAALAAVDAETRRQTQAAGALALNPVFGGAAAAAQGSAAGGALAIPELVRDVRALRSRDAGVGTLAKTGLDALGALPLLGLATRGGRGAAKAAQAANEFAHLPEPPRVYHGTAATFDRFDPTLGGATAAADVASDGFYFSGRPETADTYADLAAWQGTQRPPAEEIERQIAAGRRRVADLRARGFLRDADREWDDLVAWQRQLAAVRQMGEPAAQIRPARLAMTNPLVVDMGGKPLTYEEMTRARDRARLGGHDGITFRNTLDSADPDQGVPDDTHVVFDNKQIRSPWGDWKQAGVVGDSVATRAAKSALTPFAEVPAEQFDAAVRRLAAAKPSEAPFLTLRTPEQMRAERMQTFLSPDGTAGYALGPLGDGRVDIRNVFNTQQGNSAGAHALADALARGGNVLDHFDTGLGNFYRDFGFREYTPAGEATSRLSFADEYAPDGWDFAKHGRPDVVFQQHPTAGQLTAEQYLAGYGQARAARKGAISAPPAIHTRPTWKPTPRGVFDRSAPAIQGQLPSDPRLAVPAPKSSRTTTSPLVNAIMNSKTVRRGLDRDVDEGLTMGGREWYELGPIKADLDSRSGTGAMSFSDFNMLGGGASASNSVPNELAAVSVINYARKRGLALPEAVEHFLQMTGSRNRPAVMNMHRSLGEGGIAAGGVILPGNPRSNAWKIPSYADKRMGGGGILDVAAPGGMPALDTHERRRIMQLVTENPRLAKLARKTGAAASAASAKGALPLRNALDYQAISSLYTDGAKRYGLPTSGAYQAGRWTGGWDKTGLKSPPTGDFVQILEDALLYTAQKRGLDDSPKGLRGLWGRVAQGDDFILPWFNKGYYPIRR